jgi:hypothetical protein
VRFDVEAIREAIAAMGTRDPGASGDLREVRSGPDLWEFDDDDEFYEEYRKSPESARLWIVGKGTTGEWTRLEIAAGARQTEVTMRAGSRAQILAVMLVLEKHRAACTLPPLPKPEPMPEPAPVVFIGHGGSPQWRDLKDHLHDQHGYDVEAYEVGARAGHAVRDILNDMLARSTFAILVMTGEDEQADGRLRPRENVVHEAGLFQGRLGFSRTILLVEDGVEPFSNLQGEQQVRYPKSAIRETFGDVVATLRREFS